MKFRNKRRWQIIQQYGIGWTLAFMFLSFVRGEGTKELGSVQFEVWESLLMSIFVGPIAGIVSGFAQILSEESGYKRISIQKLLVLRILYAVLFLVFIISIAYVVYGSQLTFYSFAFEPGSAAIYFYILSVEVFMFGLRQVNLFLGSSNLWKLFRGHFYSPRTEHRIFMFLDLQASTTHAETLGHITYSKMIQDCFIDLGVVVECNAEIYQYVGDEVILTWNLADGLHDQNCLKAFFKFKDQLEKRSAHYLEEYGFVPRFKAGMNAGIVTVAEVGKYKKEIAYHGDTINTAARIQGQCNSLQQEFLIGEQLRNDLKSHGFDFQKIGGISLKGKEKETLLFAVEQVRG